MLKLFLSGSCFVENFKNPKIPLGTHDRPFTCQRKGHLRRPHSRFKHVHWTFESETSLAYHLIKVSLSATLLTHNKLDGNNMFCSTRPYETRIGFMDLPTEVNQ